MGRSTKLARRLGRGMQRLENRQLMAGDVAVEIVDNDLRITGDNASNRVDITTVNGEIQVTGTNWYGATRINGGTQPFRINAALVDDIRIDMNNGHDRVFINQVHLHGAGGDLVVDTEGGNDLVGIYNSSARDFRLNLGSGSDDAVISYSAVVRDMDLRLGSGNDELDLYAVYAGDDIEVAGEDGNDDVAIQYSQTVDDLMVKLGSHDDILWINGGNFEDIKIHGEHGNDRVTLYGTQVSDDLEIDMGSGDDKLYLHNNQVAGTKKFSGGSGSDLLVAGNNNFNAYAYDDSF